jgi:hypothetical protein
MRNTSSPLLRAFTLFFLHTLKERLGHDTQEITIVSFHQQVINTLFIPASHRYVLKEALERLLSERTKAKAHLSK